MKESLKKNVLKDIENIKQEKKLPERIRKIVTERIIANWAMCISIAVLIMTFAITAKFLSQKIAIFIYNVYSIEFMIFALIVLEIAYKKDSGKWAICGIELLGVSIFTLFSPYIFFKFSDKIIYGIIVVITIYYIAKIIKIYCSEKKRYLLEISDITDIIKKESQDEMAQKEQEKRREQNEKLIQEKLRKEQNFEKTAKKKTTTKKATTGRPATKTTTKKSTSKKTTAKKKSTTTATSKPAVKTTAKKTATKKSTSKKITDKPATAKRKTAEQKEKTNKENK